MRRWIIVAVMAALLVLVSCVTTAKYAPTTESNDDYTVTHTDEAP